jgi:hypothetical protein
MARSDVTTGPVYVPQSGVYAESRGFSSPLAVLGRTPRRRLAGSGLHPDVSLKLYTGTNCIH